MLLFNLSYDSPLCSFHFFFFNDTATTEIYTLSLHDALPISVCRNGSFRFPHQRLVWQLLARRERRARRDRKSTRLNSSHQIISYAVFCLKKKKECNHTDPNGGSTILRLAPHITRTIQSCSPL